MGGLEEETMRLPRCRRCGIRHDPRALCPGQRPLPLDTAALAIAALALSGCATLCDRHPVGCAVAGAVVVGSVAATLATHEHASGPRRLDPRGPEVRP